MARRATETVQRVGREALRLLKSNDFVSSSDIAKRAKTSGETVKRAFDWLRDQGADAHYVAHRRAWTLVDKGFALPLSEPTIDDLQAALIAAGLLAELGQDGAARRARALFDELAQRVAGGRSSRLRPTSLRVTQTTSVVRKPELMLVLLRAARKAVVRIRSVSAWTRAASSHEFEPWQVWIHDGVPYVRGFSRTRSAPRTFGLANVTSVDVLSGVKPGARIPDDPWLGEDPRYGIDHDRPDAALLQIRGAVARWVGSMRWHPKQKDEWLMPGEHLERRLPYRSCRELARRVIGIGDGLAHVEPEALRTEIRRLASGALTGCADVTREQRGT